MTRIFAWKQCYLFVVTCVSFLLPTQASEVVDPSSKSTAVVLITVLDTNDNSPQFLQNSYHFSIREDLALPGYIVTDRFNVQDEDIYVSARMRKYIKQEAIILSEKLFIERQMKHVVKKNRNQAGNIMPAVCRPQFHCPCFLRLMSQLTYKCLCNFLFLFWRILYFCPVIQWIQMLQ